MLVNSPIDLGEEDGECLTISRSRSNKVILLLLSAATLGTCLVEFFLMGRPGVVAAIFAVLTLVQVLRTYVRAVVFENNNLGSRSTFGVWRYAKYSSLLILEDPGESITFIGEDIKGESLNLSILKRDGDLNAVSIFIHNKSPHGLINQLIYRERNRVA